MREKRERRKEEKVKEMEKKVGDLKEWREERRTIHSL